MANIAQVRSYYKSPGGADDYFVASSETASRIFFPGPTAIGTATLLFWWRQLTSNGCAPISIAGTNNFISIASTTRDEFHALISNDTPATVADLEGNPVDDDSWNFVALTVAPNDANLFLNGELVASDLSLGGTFAPADTFRLFTSTGEEGDVANIAIFDRVLTNDEISAVFAAGVEHDLRFKAEGWGGYVPFIYWIESLIDGEIPNYGYGGECSLIRNGLASAVAFQPDYEEFPLPYPAKLLEAATYALGMEFNETGGVPTTYLIENYTAGDSYIKVKSTLGFPTHGYINVSNREFHFSSKTPNTFDSPTGDWQYFNIPKGTKVTSVTRKIYPLTTVAGCTPRYNLSTTPP